MSVNVVSSNGPGQLDLARGIPADCKGVGQNDLWGSLWPWWNLWICEMFPAFSRNDALDG